MRPATLPALVFVGVAVLGVACGGSSNHPVVHIVQSDGGCTPDTLALTAGRTVSLQVRNDGKKDHEVEGIEGTKLAETLIPAGHTRSLDFTPGSSGTQKIKCYVPGGSTTIITVQTAGVQGSPVARAADKQQGQPAGAYRTSDTPHASAAVTLTEWTVTLNVPSTPVGDAHAV